MSLAPGSRLSIGNKLCGTPLKTFGPSFCRFCKILFHALPITRPALSRRFSLLAIVEAESKDKILRMLSIWEGELADVLLMSRAKIAIATHVRAIPRGNACTFDGLTLTGAQILVRYQTCAASILSRDLMVAIDWMLV